MQFNRLRRREFIAMLGGAAALPVAARAQQSTMPVVGFLHAGLSSAHAHVVSAFRQGLKESGYIEGQNVAIEYRWANNENDRLPELAADLVRRRVAVIAAAGGAPSALAAKAATSTIPIVLVFGSDPVRLGLVDTLSRPGGNVTGVTFVTTELMAKRLDLLRELVPHATTVAYLADLRSPVGQDMLRDMVRGVCTSLASLDTVRTLEDDPTGYPVDFWKQLADLDLIGLMLPAKYGGSEMTALEGVVDKLNRGAKVADVDGWSTVIMAKAFPNSQFIGYDFRPNSIEHGTAHAREHGATANTRFEVAAAKEYPEKDFDLVAFFDCLHDMGDPAGAARHIRQALDADGTWLIVEPLAGDTVASNLNPVGRVYYSFSTFVCVPNARSQPGGYALGAQAGEAAIRQVAGQAGFTRFRRAAETPFNAVYEARP